MSAPMNLVHYSSGPVGPLRLMLQARGGHNHFIGKPHGLWLSVEGNGDGWRDWCLSEGFGIEWLTHVHDVSLAEGANVRACFYAYGTCRAPISVRPVFGR